MKYLKRIQNDLISDTAYFNRSVILCKELMQQNREVLRIAYQEQKTLEQYRHFVDQINTYSIPFQIHKATYLDLINSGNINIFKNDSLQTEIIQYYSDCEFTGKDIDQLNNFASQIEFIALSREPLVGKYMSKESSHLLPSMINPGDWAYMNDYNSPKFKAMYQFIHFLSVKNQFYISDFEPLDQSAQKLLSDIDKELKMRE